MALQDSYGFCWEKEKFRTQEMWYERRLHNYFTISAPLTIFSNYLSGYEANFHVNCTMISGGTMYDHTEMVKFVICKFSSYTTPLLHNTTKCTMPIEINSIHLIQSADGRLFNLMRFWNLGTSVYGFILSVLYRDEIFPQFYLQLCRCSNFWGYSA